MPGSVSDGGRGGARSQRVFAAGRNLLAGVAFSALATAMPAVARSIDVGAEWQGDQMISWAEIDVAATPAEAFAVLNDYDRMADYMPGVVKSRTVSRDGATVVVDQSADEVVLFFKQRIEVRLRIVETPPSRMTMSAVTGSFRSLDASYELTRLPGATAQTRIEYRARFVPDFDLPRMMGPFVVKRSLERHMTALASEIGRRRNATRSDAARADKETR